MPLTFDPPPPTTLPAPERTRLHQQLSYASRIRGATLVICGLVLLSLGLFAGPLLGLLTQQEAAILLFLTVLNLAAGLLIHWNGNRRIRLLLDGPLTNGRGRVSKVLNTARRWGSTAVILDLTLPDGTQANGELHHYGPIRSLEAGDTIALYFTTSPMFFFPSRREIPCDLGQCASQPQSSS